MQSVKENMKWYVLGGLFLVNFLVWHVVLAGERGGILTVAFLDVGQGDAILTSVTQYTP